MRVVGKKSNRAFIAKDGSEIIELFKSERMSLAEETVHKKTKRHFHNTSEELYHILEGKGVMAIEAEKKDVSVGGDTVVISPKEKHRIFTAKNVRFLCLCSPPYSDEDTVLG